MTSLKLQTKIHIPASKSPIDYESKIAAMGSCFVENMGGKLQHYQLQNLINPFGILFHPAAIERVLGHVANDYRFREKDLVYDQGRWHCLDAHSRFSDVDQAKVLRDLNLAVEESRRFLESATHLILTLGTAWGYRYLGSGQFVANCHKIPQRQFSKELASVNGIGRALRNTFESVRHINKNLHLILTVSPVRHLKDGFVENQRGKAHLIAGLHRVIGDFEQVDYFPSYELMMDELRDYRFYDRDLLHPNALAIDYIWERFAYCFFSARAKNTMEQIGEVQKGLNHRPFDPGSATHLKFRENLNIKIDQLKADIPHLQF